MLFSGWRRFLLIALSVCLTPRASQFNLILNQNPMALVGEFTVDYVLPEERKNGNYSIQAVTGSTVLSSAHVPRGYAGGMVTFQCGVIDTAGDYEFRLVDRFNTREIFASQQVQFSWPTVTIQIPSSMVALSGNLTLHLSVQEDLCESLHTNVQYNLRVNNNQSPQDKQLIVYEKDFSELDRFLPSRIVVPCDRVDQAGTYQAVLTSLRRVGHPMAVSNEMAVSWSTAYNLSTSSRSIFPCNSQLVLNYTHPACSGQEDKIRLYKHVKDSASPASPVREVYVEEKRIVLNQNSVSFSCLRLNDEKAVEYCFKYISTATSDGAVTEQFKLCRHPHAVQDAVVNGGWGEWSAWGACSVSCGDGRQTRIRFCDSPAPSENGDFCVGQTTEAQNCGSSCQTTTTPPPITYTPDPNCGCGCSPRSKNGKITGSNDCEGSSRWIIHADPGFILELEFEVFALNIKNRNTWIKVRDGATALSDLLVHSYGGAKPQKVRTTQRDMLIEFYAPVGRSKGYGAAPPEAFVVVYRSVGSNTTLTGLGGEGGDSGVWESTVTLVGISVCAVIIVVTAAFVCHNRLAKRNKKEEKTMAANQALLVNGEVANSPSHSGSANVSFGSPTGESPLHVVTKHEYAKPKGTNTHSPKPGRGLATPTSIRSIPSPYAVNGSPADFLHDANMLKTTCVSESPQIHRKHSKGGENEADRHYRRPRSPSKKCASSSKRQTSPTDAKARKYRTKSQSPPWQQTKAHKDQVSPKKRSKIAGPPIAREEELSPLTPDKPQVFPERRKHDGGKSRKEGENIPLNSLDSRQKKGKHVAMDTSLTSPEIPDYRPPVEGRDSLGRKAHQKNPTKSTEGFVELPETTGKYEKEDVKDVENGNVSGKPQVKPLPLRDVQRPDGQSPEHKVHDPNANSPGSFLSADMSPMIGKGLLFPDSGSTQPSPGGDFLSIHDEFEYDDIPELPGSYFTMDPHAYTLTWSQQQPWGQKSAAQRTGSEVSLDKPSASNC